MAYVPIGIMLNISSKPHYWYLSIYKNKPTTHVPQGNNWTMSMVMFLGELMTFGCIPKLVNILNRMDKIKLSTSIPSLAIVYLTLSYLLKFIIGSF